MGICQDPRHRQAVLVAVFSTGAVDQEHVEEGFVFGALGNVSRETFSINPTILTPPRASAKTRHPRF